MIPISMSPRPHGLKCTDMSDTLGSKARFKTSSVVLPTNSTTFKSEDQLSRLAGELKSIHFRDIEISDHGFVVFGLQAVEYLYRTGDAIDFDLEVTTHPFNDQENVAVVIDHQHAKVFHPPRRLVKRGPSPPYRPSG